MFKLKRSRTVFGLQRSGSLVVLLHSPDAPGLSLDMLSHDLRLFLDMLSGRKLRRQCSRNRMLVALIAVACTLCVLVTDVSDVENIGESAFYL